MFSSERYSDVKVLGAEMVGDESCPWKRTWSFVMVQHGKVEICELWPKV